MSLVDELLGGLAPRKRLMPGVRRRNFLVGDGSAPEVWREEKRIRQRVYGARYRKLHPDRYKAAQRRYNDARKEERAEYKRQWRLKNIEHVRAYQRERARIARAKKRARRPFVAWKPLTREQINARQRLYRFRQSPERKAEIAARNRAWRHMNRDRINAERREQRATTRRMAAVARAALE